MGIIGINVKFKELYQVRKKLEKFQGIYKQQFIEECAVELAKQLYDKVKEGTLVDSGTLKKGWKMGLVEKQGDVYCVKISNPTSYASYVAYGHVSKDHKKWIPGKFQMLMIPEKEMERIAPQFLEEKLKERLEELFL